MLKISGESLPDIQTTERAKTFLKQNKNSRQPFMLAIGLHKPHIPHKFPAEYLKFHPLDKIHLPSNHYIPAKLPSVAWNPYTSLRRRDDVAMTRPGWPWGPLDENLGRRIIQVNCVYTQITMILRT